MAYERIPTWMGVGFHPLIYPKPQWFCSLLTCSGEVFCARNPSEKYARQFGPLSQVGGEQTPYGWPPDASTKTIAVLLRYHPRPSNPWSCPKGRFFLWKESHKSRCFSTYINGTWFISTYEYLVYLFFYSKWDLNQKEVLQKDFFFYLFLNITCFEKANHLKQNTSIFWIQHVNFPRCKLF